MATYLHFFLGKLKLAIKISEFKELSLHQIN